MTIIRLSEWLEKELRARSWNVSQLAERSGLDAGIISRAIKRERMPRVESLIALARGLNYPPDVVFRVVGWLEETPKEDPRLDRMVNLFRGLADDDKDELLAVAQMKADRKRANTDPMRALGAQIRSLSPEQRAKVLRQIMQDYNITDGSVRRGD